MIGSASPGTTTLCCVLIVNKVIVSLWQVIVKGCQCQSWNNNFVFYVEVSVNNWQCWSWKDNVVR